MVESNHLCLVLGLIVTMASLNKLIYKSMLLSSLLPLLIIEVALLALYFGINQYISAQTSKTLIDDVLYNMQLATTREAETINAQLAETTNLLSAIQDQQIQTYQQRHQCQLTASAPTFDIHENGVFYRKDKTQNSASIYYAATTELTKERLKHVACGEQLDPVLKLAVDTKDIITQAYMNTADNMVRIYPYIDDIATVFGPSLNVADYNFYYLAADLEGNPERKNIWTSAYIDPAGQGWMISNTAPIYIDNELMGVAGVDITIEKVIKNVLDLRLPEHTSALLVDQHGTALAMQKNVEKLLGLTELTDHDYQRVIEQDIEKPEEYNLFQSADVKIKSVFEQIMHDQQLSYEAQIADKDFIIQVNPIAATNWKLITLVDKQQLLNPINNLADLAKRLGWLAMIIMVIFYVVFFLYLKYKATRLTHRVVTPVETLTQLTKDFHHSDVIERIENTGIVEIDQLSHNFSEMTQEIKRKTEALIASNQAKTDFLSNMSHELRTPLNAILGFSQLMSADKNLSEEQQENINIIHESGEHLLKLINQVLSLNKIKQGKVEFEISRVDINTLIETTLKMLSQSALDKDLSINFESSEHNVHVLADELCLKQVMINLVGNAVKFTESGNITITIQPHGINALIIIQDTGIGISEQDQTRVLQPFEQVRSIDSSMGSGLGLAISKQYIESMGGEFKLESKLGAGTKISLMLERN
jgi:signal transduction histidine kinase